ncbi:Cutinase transcription factor 1 alpha [Ceratocystis lukuohia]|uniref:Cutinase transcription factor 1 alpha n=1 Tax=Ceratocystis lukuohia TaxID=2019550 RepID=A0ABR4MTB1_9PEZI
MMPQNPQMAAYTFAPQQQQQQQQQPQSQPQRENQKMRLDYVFVDEHNRHKRLKAPSSSIPATTSSTTDFLGQSAMQSTFSHNPQQNIQSTTQIGVPEPQLYQQQQYDTSHLYQTVPFVEQQLQYSTMASSSSNLPSSHMGHAQMPPSQLPPQISTQMSMPHVMQQSFSSASELVSAASTSSSSNLYPTTPPTIGISTLDNSTISAPQVGSTPQSQTNEVSSPETGSQHSHPNPDLSDLLGSLKMNDTGTAPYLRNKASFRREQPPPEEDDDDDEDDFLANLPPMRAGKIRIPPELMPAEETSLQYFDLYFTHIHPYIPVLSKPEFYHQWNTNRSAISPLILEVLFAFGSRLADEASQGQQWLALATKHVDIFMDVPRMSTLQAVMILMKARESVPQKGYYYRSWMNIVSAIQMARELGLDEHSEEHNNGNECDLGPAECRLKTRVWQVVYTLETMIGSSQGRTQLSIDCAEVDFSIRSQETDEDISEYLVSRNFTYLARLVREIGLMNITYGKMKKKKNSAWASDPQFLKFGPALNNWRTSLPKEFDVTFPSDNSPPWIPSSFVGSLLSYHHLSKILLLRPQLSLCEPNSSGGQYKRIMLSCLSSSKDLCKLQEAVMRQYGYTGLQGMLRGYSYVVYCGLSCIVIHLVAMTSPDPEISADSGEYFSRHMRILEKVMSIWSIPDVKKQIDALRRAFSADIRKPFTLKPSFPYGSPASSNSNSPQSSTDHDIIFKQSPSSISATLDSGMQPSSFSHLSTSSNPAIQARNNLMMQNNQSIPPSFSMATWNPAPIFEQWNSTFGPPPSMRSPAGSASPSQTINNSPAATGTGVLDMAPMGVSTNAPIAASQQMQTTQSYADPQYMTPEMWQQSVVSVYEGGLKRGWDYDDEGPRKR